MSRFKDYSPRQRRQDPDATIVPEGSITSSDSSQLRDIPRFKRLANVVDSANNPATPFPFRQSGILSPSPAPRINKTLWEGYASPPRSREVSPDLKTRSITSSLSPRSRITQTLQEIQAELAESREGMEEIEGRLDVLEKHESLSREMLGRHVEDCIVSMQEEEEQAFEGLVLPISGQTLLYGVLVLLAIEYLVVSVIRELSNQRILYMS